MTMILPILSQCKYRLISHNTATLNVNPFDPFIDDAEIANFCSRCDQIIAEPDLDDSEHTPIKSSNSPIIRYKI